MSKHFVIDPKTNHLKSEDIFSIEKNQLAKSTDAWEQREQKAYNAMSNDIPLKHTVGRVIVVANVEYKNYAKLNDTKIRLERQFNNLNRRETEPVNATVVSSENMPKGAEVLIHHNALHDTNRIFGAEKLINNESSADVKYYSIKENECFLWRIDKSQWNPCAIFETALRVFKPYDGLLENVPHTRIKDVLYCTSGKLKGKVVSTLKGCDYEVIFQNENLIEERIIRFRPFGDEGNFREPEAIAIMDDLTKLVKNGKYFVGLSEKDCKPI